MSSHSTVRTYVRQLGWLLSRMLATARSARITQFALPPTTRASVAVSPGNRHRLGRVSAAQRANAGITSFANISIVSGIMKFRKKYVMPNFSMRVASSRLTSSGVPIRT